MSLEMPRSVELDRLCRTGKPSKSRNVLKQEKGSSEKACWTVSPSHRPRLLLARNIRNASEKSALNTLTCRVYMPNLQKNSRSCTKLQHQRSRAKRLVISSL